MSRDLAEPIECVMCGGVGRLFDVTAAITDAQAAGVVLQPVDPEIDEAIRALAREALTSRFDYARRGYVMAPLPHEEAIAARLGVERPRLVS